MDRIRKIRAYAGKHNLKVCFMGGALTGALLFLIIYGFCTLDVGNEAYIINEGTDLPGCLIVWDAYRYAGWKDGIGIFDTLTYPNTTSYVLADNVALLGLFFKMLSPVLPETFQYVGIWGILCFMLQGGCSALIIRKFSGSNLCSILFSLPFILASTVTTKLFYHHAQAGQWVLLMVFVIWLYRIDKEHRCIKEYIIWAAVGLVVAGTNIYFLPMVGMIFIGYSVNCILHDRKYIVSSIIALCSYLGGGVFFIAVMGGFHSNFSMDENHYAEYIDRLYRCGANLNAFFNSSGIAFFGRTMVNAKDGQGEGHAYLGAGMMIALAVAAAYRIVSFYLKRTEKDTAVFEMSETGQNQMKQEKKDWQYGLGVSLAVVFVLSVIVAIGPTLAMNEKVLCYLPYPDFLIRFWCNFRSTGRMIWPAFYVIYLFIYWTLFKLSSMRTIVHKYFTMALLAICCLIQVIDLSPHLVAKHHFFAHYQELQTTIQDEAWSVLGKNYKHMVVLPNSLVNRSDERNSFAKVAIDYNLTLNDYYLARQDLRDQTPSYQEKLAQSKFEADTFYVIPYEYLDTFLDYDLHYYKIDDYIVGTEAEISSEIGKIEIDREKFWQLSSGSPQFEKEDMDFSAVFDPAYYYYSYSDLWSLDVMDTDALFAHFLKIGMAEGRRANQKFSPAVYREKNGDLLDSFGDDYPEYYKHYITYGMYENRMCN